MSALVASSYSPAPHHRQNRRRERPGSRSRRAAPRKSLLQESFLIQDTIESTCDFRDVTLPQPHVTATPSPLLRQSFDQSWQRWKAREAQQKAQEELEKTLQDDMTQLELEQLQLFGGDVGDDELYALGILHDNEEAKGTSVVEEPPPAFVIRPGRSRRPRYSLPGKLPVDSSFYIRNSDTAIAAGISPLFYQSPIQHRASTNSINNDTPQQSLPTISATTSSAELLDSLSSPDAEDWMLVYTADAEPQQQQQHALASSTSPFEPETWILLGDDS